MIDIDLQKVKTWEPSSWIEYQRSDAGSTCSPPAKSKMATRGPQNGRLGLGAFINFC